MAYDLSQLSTRVSMAPPRLLVYGTEGIGKTTFGVQAPNPILLPFEDGADRFAIPKYVNPQTGQAKLNSLGEAIEVLQALYSQPHDRQTLVVDSLDWMEPMVWAQTCARNKWAHIEKPGFGKGYVEADDDWLAFMQWLDALRTQRKMQIICLAHAEVRQFNDPMNQPYDRYGLKLQKRALALWSEWADAVMFMSQEVLILKQDTGFNKESVRAGGTGKRIIYTEERPAFHAKNRYGLPPQIEIPDKSHVYSTFLDALMKSQ